MVGKTNSGGGGIGKVFAVIAVSYPVGSVCTCTKGTKVLTAKDTSGSSIFCIPESGTWTVVSTDGSFTRTIDMQMTTQNEVREITLSYRQWIFNNGERPIQMANGITQPGHSQGSGLIDGGVLWLTAYGTSNGIYWHTANPIDVTGYGVLTGTGRKNNDNGNDFGICISKNAIPFGTEGVYISTFPYESYYTRDRSIDIAALTGEWYVGAFINTNSVTTETRGALTQLFLE